MPNNNNQATSKMKIDVNELPTHHCPRCHNAAFIEATEIRILSMIISPSGKNEIIKVPIAVCSTCGRKVLNGDLDKSSMSIGGSDG